MEEKVIINKKANARPGAQTASRQIAEHLCRRIIEEEFGTGEKLPTERELTWCSCMVMHLRRWSVNDGLRTDKSRLDVT